MSILEGFITSGRLVTVKLLIVLLDVQSSLHCILVIPAQGKFTNLVTPGSQGTELKCGYLAYFVIQMEWILAYIIYYDT